MQGQDCAADASATHLYCRACDYNRTGTASGVCPECGRPVSPALVVRGERCRRPHLIAWGCAAGAIAVVLLVTSGAAIWQALGTPPRRTVSAYVQDFQSYVARYRAAFAAGVAPDSVHKPYPGHARVEGTLQVLCIERSRREIERQVTDYKVSAAAMAELQKAEALVTNQFVPAYRTACRSTDPATAKALVPLMDQLDAHLARLLAILDGR